MRVVGLSAALLVLSMGIGSGKEKQTASNEVCFLAVPFVQGRMVTIKLSNGGRAARGVTIQAWLSDGSPRQKISRTVPARVTTEVRADVASETPTFGWFQVTEEGPSIDVSATYEYLNGNALTTIPMLAVFRHPLSEGAVRSALKYSIH